MILVLWMKVTVQESVVANDRVCVYMYMNVLCCDKSISNSGTKQLSHGRIAVTIQES